MLTNELDPIRKILNINDEVIMEMDANGQVVNLRWDDNKQCPYFQFENLLKAPTMKGKFQMFHPAGTNELEINGVPILYYQQQVVTQLKYYVSNDGKFYPNYGVTSVNTSFTCFECTVSINDGKDEYIWKFDFDITMDLRVNGTTYNYITLTGFTITP